MSISGLGSVVEFAPEASYPTHAALPTGLTKTKSIPFNSESFDYVPGRAYGKAVRYNNALPQSDDVTLTNRVVTGSLELPLYNSGTLEWLESVYEDYTFAAATPNTHTYLIGAQGATHPSISADVIIGGTTTQEAKRLDGIIANGYSVSFSAESDEPHEISFDCLARDMEFDPTLTAAGVELTNLEQFNWAGTTITLGGAGESVVGVTMDVSIPKIPRWALGVVTTDQPDRSGRASVTGTIEMYFDNWDEAADMVAGTEQALVITAAGLAFPTESYVWTQNIHFLDGGSVMVDSEDRLTATLNWEALSSTANDQDASGHQLVVSNLEVTL